MNTTNNDAKAIARPKQGKAAGDTAKQDDQTCLIADARPKGACIKRARSRKDVTKLVTGVSSGDRRMMLKKVRQGLPFSSIEVLERALSFNRKEMSVVLSIAPSTLTRRRSSGYLLVDESDRVVRIASLFDEAVAMMQGDLVAAANWLKTPLDPLDGETPLDRAVTELGSRDIEDLMGRIRHGVFS